MYSGFGFIFSELGCDTNPNISSLIGAGSRDLPRKLHDPNGCLITLPQAKKIWLPYNIVTDQKDMIALQSY
jgi:hypothetical protein